MQTHTSEAHSDSGAALRFSTAKVGESKGAPRVWLEGRYLSRASFDAGSRIEASFERGRVTIRRAERGPRVVSSKQKRGETIPVIDLNTRALREAFGDVQALQVRVAPGEITLTALQTEAKRRDRCRNGYEGSLFSGAGLMTKAAELAGFTPRFAVEIDEARAGIYAENFPGSVMFNMSVADVPLDELRRLPVELLNITPVCGPFSNLRTQTRGQGKRDRAQAPEASPDGDLTMWAAAVIQILNPATIIVEQVPAYETSGACGMLRGFLERLGYKIETRTFDGNDFGELQRRTRFVMVAHSDAGAFSWPAPSPVTETLGDVLDPEEAVAGEYFTEQQKPWLFEHAKAQAERGNHFGLPVLTRHSTSVPAITARYFAQQGGNPVVADPRDPSRVRWLTVAEARRLQGIPEDFTFGNASKTATGEAIGEGVNVRLFRRIIAAATGRGRERQPDEFAPGAAAGEGGQLALAF